ncbi:hypothetical protein CK203_064787 [Vitis vinifera]|uniref:Uncharacterized protein n=1 Tax=Vitis vinifera TaxID=29760 RepID=A0A438FNW3_VITVI|nr:hypothetical protein CK203_064787 [Vitis vinifera]
MSSWGGHSWVPGLVNLFGIESPGLTSSMAIAEHIVARYLDDRKACFNP